MIGTRLLAVSGRFLGYPPQLLLQGEGSNGGTSIVDSSGNAFSLTNSGVTTSTAQLKKGVSSLAFGTSGYLVTPNSSQLFCSVAADWTMDFYLYPTSIVDGAYSCLFFNSGGGGGASWISSHNIALYLASTGKLYIEYRNSSSSSTALAISNLGTAIALNAWMHLALVYDSATNTLKTYQNGAVDTSTVMTSWGTGSSTPLVTFGRIDLSTSTQVRPYGGYMDQVRFTQAKRWTTNFTPD
jgi:hypothetical protein